MVNEREFAYGFFEQSIIPFTQRYAVVIDDASNVYLAVQFLVSFAVVEFVYIGSHLLNHLGCYS